ncbi:hypothetical protein Lepto7375DRAFT_4866 [Leptolyngbya sp. PCC 7375]|nr:hypothetical protein Lepto7375DRAFT_4866 [Leptolyngbya sp. PCC 7375]
MRCIKPHNRTILSVRCVLNQTEKRYIKNVLCDQPLFFYQFPQFPQFPQLGQSLQLDQLFQSLQLDQLFH